MADASEEVQVVEVVEESEKKEKIEEEGKESENVESNEQKDEEKQEMDEEEVKAEEKREDEDEKHPHTLDQEESGHSHSVYPHPQEKDAEVQEKKEEVKAEEEKNDEKEETAEEIKNEEKIEEEEEVKAEEQEQENKEEEKIEEAKPQEQEKEAEIEEQEKEKEAKEEKNEEAEANDQENIEEAKIQEEEGKEAKSEEEERKAEAEEKLEQQEKEEKQPEEQEKKAEEEGQEKDTKAEEKKKIQALPPIMVVPQVAQVDYSHFVVPVPEEIATGKGKEIKEEKEEIEVREDDAEKILIITIGTRGDLQPYVALAHGLMKGGYEVGIVTHAVYENFVEENGFPGLAFFPLESDPGKIISSEEFRKAFFEGGIMDQTKVLLESNKFQEPNYKLCWEAAEKFRPHLILCGITSISESLAISQKLNVPLVVASTIPFYPTSEFPPITLTPKPYGYKFMNSLVTWATIKMLWLTTVSGPINKFRKEVLGLPPQKGYVYDAFPHLNMYSEEVVPRPSDWPLDKVFTTGYWVLPMNKAYEPPKELADFLAAGDSPVYMGFGSMPIRDIRQLLDDFTQVLFKLQMRGIFCSGWADPASLSDIAEKNPDILIIKDAPHEWLLPRCRMAIHHGGAGTTAANLRAGIPAIIFPVLGDQGYWAERVAALGVGPPTVHGIKELNLQTLEKQIMAVSVNDKISENARALADKLKSKKKAHRVRHAIEGDEEEETEKEKEGNIDEDEDEEEHDIGDGVDNAVAFIKEYLSSQFTKRGTFRKMLVWQKDEDATVCPTCSQPFTFLHRRHHCRSCGLVYCGDCLLMEPYLNYSTPQLLCDPCSVRK